MNPDDSKVYSNLGINRKRAGKIDEALDNFLMALKKDPTNPTALFNAGVLYSMKSELAQAVEMLQQSVSIDSSNYHAHIALGDAFERQKEVKKAIGVYRDLMQLGT